MLNQGWLFGPIMYDSYTVRFLLRKAKKLILSYTISNTKQITNYLKFSYLKKLWWTHRCAYLVLDLVDNTLARYINFTKIVKLWSPLIESLELQLFSQDFFLNQRFRMFWLTHCNETDFNIKLKRNNTFITRATFQRFGLNFVAF